MTPPAEPGAGSPRRIAWTAAGILIAAAAAGLFVLSRGKWSDPLIDSGREWIVPDALSRGAVLYRDVVYWFGPLTPYLHAAFFRAFGSGFGTLVAAGAVAAAAALIALFAALRRVTGRIESALWTALAVPVLVFMPNAGGPLLGMGYRIWHAAAFSLAAVWTSSGPGRSRRRALAAGALAGLAGLCRTEWGLAALVGCFAAFGIRRRERVRAGGDIFLALGSYALCFGGGIAAFVAEAGWNAVVSESHVLLTGLPEETRHFLVAFSGVADWKRGLAEVVYSAAMWSALFALIAWLFRPDRLARSRSFAIAASVLLAVLAAAAWAGGAGGAVLFSAAPLVCAAGLVAGFLRRRGSAAAMLTASGWLGAVTSYRRPFHIGDSAYVGPPLLFAFVCAAGLLRLAVAAQRRGSERRRLAAAFRAAPALLAVCAFAGRAWQYAAIEGVPIAGTDRMLSARRETAREIEDLAAAVRDGTRDGDGLVAFPEGEILNRLSGRSNPLRHELYLPGYLTASNESAILEELSRARPAAIVIWRRPVTEYARGLFGSDYGRDLRWWIDENYRMEPFRAKGAAPRASAKFEIGFRR